MEVKSTFPPSGSEEHSIEVLATAVSRGIASGKAVCLFGTKRQYFLTRISPTAVDDEVARFHGAVAAACEQLSRLVNDGDPAARSSAGIFDAHLLMLEHSTLASDVESFIRKRLVSAEWALRQIAEDFADKQSSISDANLRDRVSDFEDVCERVLSSLDGGGIDLPTIPPNSVIVASIIRPSTLIELGRHRPVAIVTEHGGWTSHSFIMAREMKIPAVTGVKSALRLIRDDMPLLVDGYSGRLVINPTAAAVAGSTAFDRSATPASSANLHGSTTADGREIVLRANVDRLDQGFSLSSAGTKGIGLLRSEYLFPNIIGGLPGEQTQFEAFDRVAEACGPDGVRIRTFDLHVDHLTYLAEDRELNPALGLRAIRLSFADEKRFREQIRAILRANSRGNVSIVLPMISGVADITRVRRLIAEEKQVLFDNGSPLPDLPVGAMIEVPAAVMTIDNIVKHVDFICLGTNDLVQYLLAADRDNEAVAANYQTLHPSVIRSISSVIRAADQVGISTVVCGEMAGSPFYLPLLIGLGAREFSMNPNSLNSIRSVVAGISFEEANDLARHVATFETAEEIEKYLRDFYSDNWPHLQPLSPVTARSE
ncbi:MAG: phosphoenolpyruvate--protein phosphotransferase [Pyrinomonadaceae bacterium]|nr:phosphoenolpyruvate--protein phosphotransferase [Pyrinomonadaceae bacterium]